jgi:hypothetical protein
VGLILETDLEKIERTWFSRGLIDAYLHTAYSLIEL